MSRLAVRIACPHYQSLVAGWYDLGSEGSARGFAGPFLVRSLTCCQAGGRCGQVLCGLHRLNRGGPRTWFPERVVPVGHAPRTGAGGERPRRHGGSGFSIEA